MSYSTIIPAPLPVDGYRQLTPYETAQRAAAMTCIHQRGAGECQGQVYATVFFDGTGNNQEWTEPKTSGSQQVRNKHSNIARLFNARVDKPDEGFFAYYIPGVGTPFKEIGDNSAFLDSWIGNGAGYMGADRINWGITRIFNAVHAYVTDGHVLLTDDTAKTLVNTISSNASGYEGALRVAALQKWEQKLAAVLKGAQRKVTSINVAVFGFSRGAAKARAFAHWLSELLQRDAGGYDRLAGVPFRLYFMGLFDTVASVGSSAAVPGLDGHMAWADGTQSIPDHVDQCVHYIALHEQRAAFPLEMASKAKQVAYPGMHSDVGGGYLPTEQGKIGQLSQIPLNDMHYEAVKAGVPLLTRHEMAEPSYAAVKKQFDIPPELIEAYNAYWRDCGIGAASGKQAVLKAIDQHVRQYLQWHEAFPTKIDLQYRDFYRRATEHDRVQLREAQDDLAQQAKNLRTLASSQANYLVSGLGPIGPNGSDSDNLPVGGAARELYSAAIGHTRVTASVAQLFNDYVHDSRAGFRVLGRLEPHHLTGGYLRYRNVYQNNREQTASAAAASSSVPSTAGVAQAVSPGDSQGAMA